MCGISGIIHDDAERPVEHHILEKMGRTMIHRGPDDEGYFIGRGVGFAIRRLAIIDIDGGHQPFLSEDGNIASVCNGEIYNFKELKAELAGRGHVFRTRSDAEVIPHLYEEYGADFVSKLNGMFGLALWDELKRVLIIARDRMGEKSLYWTHSEGIFAFASELKALLAHPDIEPRIDPHSLSRYLALEYIPAPHTIMEGIYKLKPGHLLIFKGQEVTVRQYWDIPKGPRGAAVTVEEAEKKLKALLKSSVEKRLMSDVPLGVFLSGGIDSSSILAMMSKIMDARSIKTFSIAFAEKSFDESSHAKKVAAHFKTEHREKVFTAEEFIGLLPRVLGFLDEPFADASILPTYALSLFVRNYVKVALGGDGGDELFAGYPTFIADRFAAFYRLIPSFIRNSIIAAPVSMISPSDKNMSVEFKLKQFIKGAHIKDASRHFVWMGSFDRNEQRSLLNFDPPEDIYEDVMEYDMVVGHVCKGNRLLYLYKKLYLAEDILAKVDRASMAASLEVRAPFLDHELVEYVSGLPYSLKLKGLTTKYILKRAMKDVLPASIIARPKKGFGIPVAQWFKGPLKKMLIETLDLDRIRQEGYFKTVGVLKLIKDHVEGRADNRKKLWTLFMFENWMERWG